MWLSVENNITAGTIRHVPSAETHIVPMFSNKDLNTTEQSYN